MSTSSVTRRSSPSVSSMLAKLFPPVLLPPPRIYSMKTSRTFGGSRDQTTLALGQIQVQVGGLEPLKRSSRPLVAVAILPIGGPGRLLERNEDRVVQSLTENLALKVAERDREP